MDAEEVPWFVCTKDVRVFTGGSIFRCPLRFSPQVRCFFGVRRKRVSSGRIHKKTPPGFPWQEFFASTYLNSYQGAIDLAGVISL
jgi:hypothetical protein